MAIQETVFLDLSGNDTREMEWCVVLDSSIEEKDKFITEVTSTSGNSTIPTREIPIIARREDSEFVHLSLTNDEVRQLSADGRIFDIENIQFTESLVEPHQIRINPPFLSAYDPYTADTYDFNTNVYPGNAGASNQANFNTAYAPMHRILNTSSEYVRSTIGYLSGQAMPNGSGGFTTNPAGTEVRTDGFNGDVTQIYVPNQQYYGQGHDVDVIITDEPMSYDMGEWNDPDTGVSRFVQYDWYNSDLENLLNQKYNNSIPDLYKGSRRSNILDNNDDPLPSDYRYRPNSDNPYYHGTHVGSTVAGRWYGYAPKANIYHINILRDGDTGDGYGYIPSTLFADFIRGFHALKPVNPKTGRKNPTIVQASWGSSYKYTLQTYFPNGISLSDIVQYQWFNEATGAGFSSNYIFSSSNPPVGYGDGTWSESNLYQQFGLRFGTSDEAYAVPASSTTTQRSVIRMIRDGINFVTSAGNSDHYIVHSATTNDYYKSTHPDFQGRSHNVYSPTIGIIPQGKLNSMSTTTRVTYDSNLSLYHHRAGSPIVPGAIVVGSTGTLHHERKSQFSNYGPAVDVYAPGEDVLGAFNYFGYSDDKYGGAGLNQYYRKISGTSMASPQVAGILAVAASNKSRFTPIEAKGYLKTVGLSGAINANQGHLQRNGTIQIDSSTETSFVSGGMFSDRHSMRDSNNLTVRMMNPRAVLTRSFSAYPNFTDLAGVQAGYTDGKGAGQILDGGHYQTLQMWDFATNGTAVRTVNNSLDDPASHGYYGDTKSTVTSGQAANYKKGDRDLQWGYFIPESVPGDSSAISWDNTSAYSQELYPLTRSEKWNECQYGRRGSNQKWPRPGIFMETPTSMLSTLAVNHSEYAAEVAGGNPSGIIRVLANDPDYELN